MLAPRWGLQAIFHAPCLEITGFGKTSRIARSTSSDAQMMSASLGIVSYLSPAWRVSFTNKKKPSKLLWQLYMPGRPEHFLTSKGISKHEGSWSIWNIWRKLVSNMEKPSSYVYIYIYRFSNTFCWKKILVTGGFTRMIKMPSSETLQRLTSTLGRTGWKQNPSWFKYHPKRGPKQALWGIVVVFFLFNSRFFLVESWLPLSFSFMRIHCKMNDDISVW